MSNKNISFVGLGRIRDRQILASVFDRLQSQEKTEIETSFMNYLLDGVSRFSPGSREKRHFNDSTMFMLADRELSCVYALAVKGKSYPERLAYAALTEFVQIVSSNDETKNPAQQDTAQLSKILRKPMKDLMVKYDDPAKIDKTSEVGDKVDHVKGIMQDNIQKVLATHANLEDLEQKTENLNQNAAQFNRSANDLKRIMWWQKTKMMIVLILVVCAVLAYIGLMIAKLVS
eukprot:GHVP01036814.1.p1 GENE.GHVP01036814.1~~GHVP01036814.1.p1  ORF type:complete len:231 (+),score=32.35 GHVP01036814.1:282-974(+)